VSRLSLAVNSHADSRYRYHLSVLLQSDRWHSFHLFISVFCLPGISAWLPGSRWSIRLSHYLLHDVQRWTDEVEFTPRRRPLPCCLSHRPPCSDVTKTLAPKPRHQMKITLFTWSGNGYRKSGMIGLFHRSWKRIKEQSKTVWLSVYRLYKLY